MILQLAIVNWNARYTNCEDVFTGPTCALLSKMISNDLLLKSVMHQRFEVIAVDLFGTLPEGA